jgi:putative effector of murein hydrolase
MGAMTETTPTKPAGGSGMFIALIVTFLLLPAGVILSLVLANKARQHGQPQQPIWTGCAIGAVLAVIVAILLTR